MTVADVEVRAKALGWVPKEQFRGAEEKWVDADEFVERGEQILPIVKANNRELQSKLDAVRAENARLSELFTASQEAIEELKKYQSTETERQVKAARADIVAELKKAKKEGDTDLEVDLQQQLGDLDKAVAKAPAVPATPAPAASPAEHPDFKAWKEENSWFEEDENRAAVAVTAANRLRANGDRAVGRAFFDKVSVEVEKAFGTAAPTRKTSKVEAAGGGANGGTPQAGGKKFSDLPADAKAACTRQAEKLVGKGRAFKDMPSWQAHYVEQYFLGEQ